MTTPERITDHSPEWDDLTCICGNHPQGDGFYPSDTAGEYTEPAIGGEWDGNHITCTYCGRIIDTGPGNGIVVGTAAPGWVARMMVAENAAWERVTASEHRRVDFRTHDYEPTKGH